MEVPTKHQTLLHRHPLPPRKTLLTTAPMAKRCLRTKHFQTAKPLLSCPAQRKRRKLPLRPRSRTDSPDVPDGSGGQDTTETPDKPDNSDGTDIPNAPDDSNGQDTPNPPDTPDTSGSADSPNVPGESDAPDGVNGLIYPEEEGVLIEGTAASLQSTAAVKSMTQPVGDQQKLSLWASGIVLMLLVGAALLIILRKRHNE